MDKPVNLIQHLGLFGGTFDPIHIGHLQMALYAKEKFQLDQIDFIVAKNPPFKENKVVLDYESRFSLVQKAIEIDRDFTASDFERHIEGTSYTYKTIEYYKKTFPCSKLFWIIGYDAFSQLQNWANYEYLRENLSFIVFCRDHIKDAKALDERLEYKFVSDFDCDASSTMIRNIFKNSKDNIYNELEHYLPSNIVDLAIKNYSSLL